MVTPRLLTPARSKFRVGRSRASKKETPPRSEKPVLFGIDEPRTPTGPRPTGPTVFAEGDLRCAVAGGRIQLHPSRVDEDDE
jgi:hypothetical protein